MGVSAYGRENAPCERRIIPIKRMNQNISVHRRNDSSRATASQQSAHQVHCVYLVHYVHSRPSALPPRRHADTPTRPYALLAPSYQPPEFLFIQNSNIQRTRFLQFAAGVITR